MKKIACLVLAASLAMFAAGCGGSPAGGEGESAAPLTGVTLNVFNWGEYIDDEDYKVNDRFTFETGIKVNYKNFTDNESMYAVISSGAAEYDVVFPSDYMVGKMRKEGMLEKINFERRDTAPPEAGPPPSTPPAFGSAPGSWSPWPPAPHWRTADPPATRTRGKTRPR